MRYTSSCEPASNASRYPIRRCSPSSAFLYCIGRMLHSKEKPAEAESRWSVWQCRKLLRITQRLAPRRTPSPHCCSTTCVLSEVDRKRARQSQAWLERSRGGSALKTHSLHHH